jgi:hypothetical protein
MKSAHPEAQYSPAVRSASECANLPAFGWEPIGSPDRLMGMIRTSAALAFGALFLVACSSTETVSAPEPAPTSTPETTTPTTTSPTPTSDPAPSTTTSTVANTSLTLTCDADSGENPTFEVPLGTEVTLIATSSIEREFHLHGYDIELTGTDVTFQFVANLPGPHELTEHPDHATICTLVS